MNCYHSACGITSILLRYSKNPGGGWFYAVLRHFLFIYCFFEDVLLFICYDIFFGENKEAMSLLQNGGVYQILCLDVRLTTSFYIREDMRREPNVTFGTGDILM